MSISPRILNCFITQSLLFIQIHSTQIATSDLATNAAIESQTQTEIPCASSDPSYEHSLKIKEGVEFYWTSIDDVLHGSLRYDGLGWLGFGISDSSGSMVGADAIIGQPDLAFEDKDAVLKYDIDSDKLSGIVPMEESMQTLEDATLTQDDSTTVLAFSKILKEDGEKEIKASGENVFIYAVGATNTLGAEKWGSFTLDLSNCDDLTKLEAEMMASSEVVMSADSSSSSKKAAFIAHGILMAFAWSVCASFAVATAWFRRLAPTWWIYMHVLANVSCFILTLIAFIIVVVAVERNPNTTHFAKSHHYVGVVLMMFVSVQVMNGFMRPPVEKIAYPGAEKQWSARDSWHVVHKYSGITLLILSVYQISSGLHLFSQLFGTKSLVTVYWSSVFVFLITVLAVKLSMVCDLRPKETNDGNKQVFTTLDEVDFGSNVHDDISSLEASHIHNAH